MRFIKILENVNSLPNYLYHVTPKENLEEIKRKGLNPQKSESSSKGIYLSDDEFTAVNYTNMRPEVDHVLFKIDTSYLNEDKLGPDDYELKDFLKRNDWEIKNKRYDSVYDLSWKQSIKYVNQVVYYDKIPPEALSRKDSKFMD